MVIRVFYRCRSCCKLRGKHIAINSTIQGYVKPEHPPVHASFISIYLDCNGSKSTDYSEKNFLNYKSFCPYLSQITLQYKMVNCEMRSHIYCTCSAIILLSIFEYIPAMSHFARNMCGDLMWGLLSPLSPAIQAITGMSALSVI